MISIIRMHDVLYPESTVDPDSYSVVLTSNSITISMKPGSVLGAAMTDEGPEVSFIFAVPGLAPPERHQTQHSLLRFGEVTLFGPEAILFAAKTHAYEPATGLMIVTLRSLVPHIAMFNGTELMPVLKIEW